MEPVTWAIIAGAAVVVLLLILLAFRARRRRKAAARSGELHERFGPEYERTITTRGRDEGERELEERVDRYRRSPARPLTADDRNQVITRWSELQAAYVDSPSVAVQRAEVLLRTILDRREVPSDHLDDRVTAAAFVRPDLADQYRKAHRVFVDVEADRGGPEVEHDQRMAFLVYRQLILEHAREQATEAPSAVDDRVEIRHDDLAVSNPDREGMTSRS